MLMNILLQRYRLHNPEELAPAYSLSLPTDEDIGGLGLWTLSKPTGHRLDLILGELLPVGNGALTPLATDISRLKVYVFHRNVAYLAGSKPMAVSSQRFLGYASRITESCTAYFKYMHRAIRRTRQMAPLRALRASCSKSYGMHGEVYVFAYVFRPETRGFVSIFRNLSYALA